MSDLRTIDRVFLMDFIQIYKENPCLWKIKSKEYFNKRAKTEAYGKLLCKMKEVDRGATRDTVVKKINSFRTTFRKERRKILERNETDPPYVPNLWYYNLLLFLLDQDPHQDYDTNFPNYNDQEAVEIPDMEEDYILPQPIEELPIKKKMKKSKNLDKADTVLDLVAQNLQQYQEGPLDIFGRYVASQLAQLPAHMVIIAQKCISNILYESKLGNLTNESKIVNVDMPKMFDQSPHFPTLHEGTTPVLPVQYDTRDTANCFTENTGDGKMDTEPFIDEEQLIYKVIEFPNLLHDKNGRSDRDKVLIEKLWKKVSISLNCPVNICQDKWQTLREQFWREHERVTSPEIYGTNVKLWKWYNIMSCIRSDTHENTEIDNEMEYTNDSLPETTDNSETGNTPKHNNDKSLTLANEDEAFFISLLPTVNNFDNDDKLDFRGEVLASIRKIKRSNKAYNCLQADRQVSGGSNLQIDLTETSSEIQHKSPLVDSLNISNFVHVKLEDDDL